MKKLALILAIVFLGTGFIQAQPPSGSQAVAPAKMPTNSTTLKQEPAINSTNTGINVTSDNKKAVQDNTGSIVPQTAAKTAPKVEVDNSGSVSDAASAKPATKKTDVSGSVMDTPAAKQANKKLDTDGSLLEVVPAKPTPKPIEPKVDNSKLQTQAAKPTPQKVDNSGSVAPDTKKAEVKPVAPKSTEASSLNGN